MIPRLLRCQTLFAPFLRPHVTSSYLRLQLSGSSNRFTKVRTFSAESTTGIDSNPADKQDDLTTPKPFFTATPIKIARAHVDRDKRSHRVGVGQVAEGTAGEKIFEFIDPRAVNYPTLETLKEPFGGIPFCELPEVRMYLSKNNTKVAVVDYKGTYLFGTSASVEGFKNCKKKTEVAGQTVGVSAGNKCLRRGLTHVRVILSGLGPGRQSCVLGMVMTGVKIVSLSDQSPLPEMGPRPRKARRL